MRKKIIAANWKMHKTVEQTTDFLRELASHDFPGEAWVAPPFTSLHIAAEFVRSRGIKIQIGGQNMHEASHGAFTGEISGSMLKEAGATFCIIGHSERRNLFHESDHQINAKLRSAFAAGLTPIFCIGEHEAARDSGEFMEQIELQISAYEPVWAIGTGKAATPQIAQETHRRIRSYIAKRWGDSIADTLPLLYGGSANEANAGHLLSESDIDGLLIGGASLEVKTFLAILSQVKP
jgi:triosephosphate isomerase